MKFKLPITAALIALILTSCVHDTRTKASVQASNSDDPMEIKTAEDEFAGQDLFQNKDLDELVGNFQFSPKNQGDFQFESGDKQFPPKLINDLMETVRSGEIEELFHNMNQKSLMITAEDFVFQPSKDKDMNRAEKDLYEAIQRGAGNFLIYQCDVDRDGIDEIMMTMKPEFPKR